MRKRIPVLILLLVFILPLAGCAAAPKRSPVAGPDWSRGVAVGEQSFNDTVALLPDPDGAHVHMAWGQVSAEKGDDIHYVQIDGQARVTQDRDLPFAVQSPHQVHLVADGQGGLIITWLSGVSEKRRLYAAHLDGQGLPTGDPHEISLPDRMADEHTVVPGAGGADVLWCNNERNDNRGIFHVRLDATAGVAMPSRLLVAGGISPDAQVSADGRVYVAYGFEPSSYLVQIYLAELNPGAQSLGTPIKIDESSLSSRTARFGPVLGLTPERAYVVWAVELLAATYNAEAGEGECHYAEVALDGKMVPQTRSITLSPLAQPGYAPARGSLAYTQLAQQRGTSPLVYMPQLAPGVHDEAVLAVAYQTATNTKSRVEIGVAYLDRTGVKGYQLAGRATSSATLRPSVAADAAGQLYLAWLEPAGFNNYTVFFASTQPAVRAALGRLQRQDILDAAATAVWTVAQAFAMFPIAIVWLFVPFVWVVGFYIVRSDGQMDRRSSQVGLGVAVLLYVLTKFILLPMNFLGAAPFLDRLPAAVGSVYILALPFVVLAVALGVVWLFVRRRLQEASLFGCYIVFAVTDALLTFLVYGPGVAK